MTDDSLTGEEVRGFAAAFSADRTARIVQNAVAETPIDKVAMDREIVTSIDPSVSVKVDTWPITNQKKSGRCWLFSGLNSLKSAVYPASRNSSFPRTTSIFGTSSKRRTTS